VVDFLEISLFTKFVVSWAGLLSDDSCLIDLFLKLGEDIWELDVILIDFWNLRHLLQIKLTFGLELKPLLLEAVKSLLHSKFDEEISQKFITGFLSTSDLTKLIVMVDLTLLDFEGSDRMVL